MRIFWVSVCTMIFGLMTVNGQTIYRNSDQFDPSRDAEKDFQEAVAFAKANQVRILVEVGGEWCSWCRRLNRLIEEHTAIKEMLFSHFAFLRINYSKENKNETFLSRYPVIKGYPHIFVLNENGELLHSQDTGEWEEGQSYSENQILQFLQRWKIPKD